MAAVPGVAQATQTFGGALQGGSNNLYGNLSVAPIYGPAAPKTNALGDQTQVQTPNFKDPLTAKVTTPGTTTTTQWAPRYYNGQMYNDPTEYANAVIGDAQTAHDTNVKQINQAYQNGLISFQQQQDLIGQNRDSLKQQLGTNLSNNSGYFNSISPDATQSQQGVYEGKINDNFNTANGRLDTQAANLGTAQQGFTQNYQNQLQGADQSLASAKDSALNGTLPQTSTSGGSTSTSNVDPSTLVQNIALAAIGGNAAGLNLQQSQQSVEAQLASQGLNPAQYSPYINYVYGGGGQKGILNDPNNPYGSAYAKKSSQLMQQAG